MLDGAVELVEQGDARRAWPVGGAGAIIAGVAGEHHAVDDQRVLARGEQLGEAHSGRVAVRSLGKNVYGFKMQALVIGGVISALAGIVWAHGNAISPDSMGRTTTFWIWTMLLLGGAATVFGPILGTALFWAIYVAIKQLAPIVLPNLASTQVEPIALAAVGFGLILLIVFRPQGILGDKREIALNG